MKVSVIVPVYNVERYLKKCVESIIAQTYRNLQIILVDDGSTDDSGKLCDDLAQTDSRIRVIHKKNGGVSSARNTALDEAKGDFIVFVDSDDYINPEYIDYLLALCINNSCKEAQISYRYVQDDIWIDDTSGKKVVAKKWRFSDLYCSPSRIYRAIVCGKIFASELFDNYRFPEGKVYEDEEAAFYLSYYAENIMVSNRPMYFYRMSSNSIMRNTDKYVKWDFLYLYKGIIRFLEDREEYLLLEGVRKELCIRLLSKYIIAKKNKYSSQDLCRLLNEYKEQFSKINCFRCFSLKESTALLLFRIAPNILSLLENKMGIILKAKMNRVQIS